MRRVVNSREVYHLWAHQAQSSAYTSNRNIRFIETEAYSYATVIGRILTAPNGERVYLLDRAQFSVSTSQHQTYLYMAVHNRANVFTIESGRRGQRLDYSPSRILAMMLAPIPALIGKAKRARTRRQRYERDIQSSIESAARFAALFNLPAPPIDAASIEEQIGRLEEEERERNRQMEAEQRRVYEERNRQAIAEAKTLLPRWLSHAKNEHGYPSVRAGELHALPFAYLRLSQDGTQVETTRGATVPIAHARRVLPIVLDYLTCGKTYQRNGHTIHVGYYPLDRIDADGTVYIGCHTFERVEIERFAAALANP